MKMRTKQRSSISARDYSSNANCRTNIPAIFRGIFGIFHGISKFLFIYSTTHRGTPNDVLWNPGWETLAWRVDGMTLEMEKLLSRGKEIFHSGRRYSKHHMDGSGYESVPLWSECGDKLNCVTSK
jgi:hypothetical protein